MQTTFSGSQEPSRREKDERTAGTGLLLKKDVAVIPKVVYRALHRTVQAAHDEKTEQKTESDPAAEGHAANST